MTGGNSFLFASFFRLQTEKIVLGYNNDKIVLAISKNSRFAKIHSLLKYNQKEKPRKREKREDAIHEEKNVSVADGRGGTDQ